MATTTKEGYFEELLDIKCKLKDFIELLNSGKYTYYKELALKLRIMYIYKSGTKSLLKTISDLYNIELYVFIKLNINDKIEKGLLPASLGQGLVIEQVNSVVGWFESGNELIGVFDAINKDEVLINQQRYSYKQLIEYAADKMGGAHLDKNHDGSHLLLHSDSLLIGGLPIAQRAIYDTAMASIKLISYIEQYISHQEPSQFIIPSQDSTPH